MLKLRRADNKQPGFWALDNIYKIGRAASNQLCLEHESVDLLHAKIIKRGETYLLCDENSQSGTYLNNKRIIDKVTITCGDHLRFGNIAFNIIDPLNEDGRPGKWALIASSSWLRGQEIALPFQENGKTLVLGRSNNCDIVIPGKHLSRQHAELWISSGQVRVRDLVSVNGTYVNNKRAKLQNLQAGDELKLDVYRFILFGPGINLPQAATQSIQAIKEEDLQAYHIANSSSKEKLWKTRSSSPGNREQVDLYRRHWVPAAVASGLFLVFCAGVAFVLYGR